MGKTNRNIKNRIMNLKKGQKVRITSGGNGMNRTKRYFKVGSIVTFNDRHHSKSALFIDDEGKEQWVNHEHYEVI